MVTFKQRVSRIKLRFVLPAAQLAIAITLILLRTPPPGGDDGGFYVSPSVLICYGLNAPALFVKVLGIYAGAYIVPLTKMPVSFLGIGIEQFPFFAGVVLLWFLVGLRIDRLGSGAVSKFGVGSAVANVLLFLLGGLLLFLALEQFLPLRGVWFRLFDFTAETLLFLTWAVVLMFIAARRLAIAIREKMAPHTTGDSTEGRA